MPDHKHPNCHSRIHIHYLWCAPTLSARVHILLLAQTYNCEGADTSAIDLYILECRKWREIRQKCWFHSCYSDWECLYGSETMVA